MPPVDLNREDEPAQPPPEPGLGERLASSAADFLPGDYEYERKGITNLFLMFADRAVAGAIDVPQFHDLDLQ